MALAAYIMLPLLHAVHHALPAMSVAMTGTPGEPGHAPGWATGGSCGCRHGSAPDPVAPDGEGAPQAPRPPHQPHDSSTCKVCQALAAARKGVEFSAAAAVMPAAAPVMLSDVDPPEVEPSFAALARTTRGPPRHA
jgi:hypothetical protein